MSLVINSNLASISAQRSNNDVQYSLNKTMERIASGLRINSAQDDVAGMAIASRMSGQIRGMNQAMRNVNDGISITQTASGSLEEMTMDLSRIRELAIQSANGTYSNADRAAIQKEALALTDELKRVGSTTEFNGIKLLDGSMKGRTFQIGADQSQTVDLTIDNLEASSLGKAVMDSTGATNSISQAVAGTTNNVTAQTLTASGTIGEAKVAVTAGDSAKKIAEGFNAVSSQTGINASATTTATISGVTAGRVEFTLQGANTEAITISSNVDDTSDLSAIADAVNAQSGSTNITASADKNGNLVLTDTTGNDIKISNTTADTGLATATVRGGDFTDQKTGESVGSGEATGPFGNSSHQSSSTITVGGSVRLSSTTAFSVGTDGDNTVVATPQTQSRISAVTGIDLGTAEGAQEAVGTVDAAMMTLAKARENLGAMQNRFGSAINNLQSIQTNLTDARSRIQDTDFAAEVAQMTRGQILQQSGVALLSQANQVPQQVLSLLRG